MIDMDSCLPIEGILKETMYYVKTSFVSSFLAFSQACSCKFHWFLYIMQIEFTLEGEYKFLFIYTFYSWFKCYDYSCIFFTEEPLWNGGEKNNPFNSRIIYMKHKLTCYFFVTVRFHHYLAHLISTFIFIYVLHTTLFCSI